MLQDYPINLDLKNRKAVSSVNDPSSPAFQFVQGDTINLVLNGLLPITDPSLQKFNPAHIDWATLQAAVLLVDAPPRSGTFKVQVGTGDTAVITAALTYDANLTKTFFATALNALSNVTTAGGVVAIQTGAANVFGFIWNTPANALPVSIISNNLAPLTFSAINTDLSIPGKVEIKLHQAPVAFTSDFSLPTPPAPTIARVRAGSTSANEIQRLSIDPAAVGGFAFVQGGNAGEIVRVNSSSLLADITAALNDPYTSASPTDIRFSVTNPATGIFDIEFIGTFAKTSESLLVLDLFDQVPIDTPSAKLGFTSVAIEDLLNGAASVAAKFVIVADNSAGEQSTLLYTDCTILADGLDPQTTSSITTIATRVDTVYVYPDPLDPTAAATYAMAVAKLGTQFTNPSLAANFVFNHSFATTSVDVTVLVKTGVSPDTWSKMPDDQFEVDILNDSQVQLYFGDTIPAAPAVGSVQVWICTLDATPILNTHRHTTDEIDGVAPHLGSTLTEIIATLLSSLPTGWPNIPANKISGTISADQIDLTSLSQAFTSSSDFLTTLRTLINDSTLITNLSQSLTSNSAFLTTLETVAGNSTFLTSLITALASSSSLGDLTTAIAGSPAFSSAVNSVIGTLQVPGAMTMPIAAISEVLFSTPTNGPAIANSRPPYMLPQIVAASPTSLTTTTLPTITANSVWQNNSGSALSIPGGGGIRTGTVATAGFIGSDGRMLFPAAKRLTTNSYFPESFKRELWRLWIDDKMLPVGKTFSVAFAVALQLINATCDAQWVLVIEKGVADAGTTGSPSPENFSSGITWDETNPLVKQRIILTQNQMVHSFGAIIANTSTGITAQGNYYGASYTAPAAPASANFVLRARLIEFDTENSVSTAKGWVSYSLQPDSYGQLGAKIA